MPRLKRLTRAGRAMPARARRLASSVRTSPGRRAIKFGVLPTVTPQPMLRRLQPDFVVDVGANRGQFALDVVTACPHAVVVSFEPLASERDVFNRIFGEVPNVSIQSYALADETGNRMMNVSRSVDSSSLLEISTLQNETFPGTALAARQRIDVVPLRDAVDLTSMPVKALLKADVQGAELAVLRGAGDALRRFKWVYLEASFLRFYEDQPLAAEVIDFLHDAGFALTDMATPLRVCGRSVQVDLLFERLDGVGPAGPEG